MINIHWVEHPVSQAALPYSDLMEGQSEKTQWLVIVVLNIA